MSSSVPVQISVTFSKFVRYFVPGWFSAALMVIFGIRLAHIDSITRGTQLLGFLHLNWASVVGMIIALGAFVGICLVSLDVIVRQLMSSRLAHLAFRYLLSSRAFRLPFVHFIDLYLTEKRVSRLTIRLIANSNCCPEIKRVAQSGIYEEKCILREASLNFLMSNLLKNEPAVKAELNESLDFSSMFLSMSFAALVFFAFQLSAFIRHFLSQPVALVDYLLVVLFGYVVVNLVLNRKAIFQKGMKLVMSTTLPKRLHYYAIGFIVAAVVGIALYEQIYGIIPWFCTTDPLLLYALFLLFTLMYWAGAYEYANYAMKLERELYENKQSLLDYLDQNCHQIRDMIEEYISYRP